MVLDRSLDGVEPSRSGAPPPRASARGSRAVGYGRNDARTPMGIRFRKDKVPVLAVGSAVAENNTRLGRTNSRSENRSARGLWRSGDQRAYGRRDRRRLARRSPAATTSVTSTRPRRASRRSSSARSNRSTRHSSSRRTRHLRSSLRRPPTRTPTTRRARPPRPPPGATSPPGAAAGPRSRGTDSRSAWASRSPSPAAEAAVAAAADNSSRGRRRRHVICRERLPSLRRGRRRPTVSELTTRSVAFTTALSSLGSRFRAAKLLAVRTPRSLAYLVRIPPARWTLVRSTPHRRREKR